MNDSSIEIRSLQIGKWGNLVMAIAGVVTAYLSRSDAILVDGLFSGVNFASAIIAARVGAIVLLPPDREHPWGFEAYEAVYVMFRSLVLVGVTVFASFSAGAKILAYSFGEQVPELVLGPIVIYTLAMSLICFGLAAWHRVNWRRSGKQSEVLKIESNASSIDGCISLGAGAALIGTLFLVDTPLDFLIPITDAILVLILSLLIIRQPTTSMFKALRELTGGAASPDVSARIRETTADCQSEFPFEIVDIIITKIGRVYTVVPSLKPTTSICAEQVDELRARLQTAYHPFLDHVRVEVLVTARTVALQKDLSNQPTFE